MKKFFSKLNEFFQLLGRSMLLAISVMPAAAILNRLASDDLFNIPFLKEAAWTIFAILPMLFAVSVAGGIAKDKHVAAGLSSLVVYEILVRTLRPIGDTMLNSYGREALPTIESNILVGIIAGIIAGFAYEKYKDKKLPSALEFFSGRRLVVIMSSFYAIIAGIIMSFIFPTVSNAFDAIGLYIGGIKPGPFIFGFLNRILIPTGLHHVVNTYIQMQLPSPDPAFVDVVGEIPRYFAGDPTAGTFVSGFFPMMMFGLMGAAYAMYKTARDENKEQVKGLLFGAALTSFVTGITEPIEFSFMFVSPLLFLTHAILTGLSNVLSNLFNIRIVGVGGSGIVDYVLQFNKSTNPFRVIIVGIILAALYYFIFKFLIIKFDLKTPGREMEDTVVASDMPIDEKSRKILELIGGKENVVEIDNCITRLRLIVNDFSAIDKKGLKELGIIEVIQMSNGRVHVVVGLGVESIANQIKELL